MNADLVMVTTPASVADTAPALPPEVFDVKVEFVMFTAP